MSNIKKHQTRIILGLILLLAFVLRFERPTLVEFKRDEATVARLAQAIAYEGYLPAVGVNASMGIDNLPLTLYLMALPARLWSDPLAPVLFTMLLNALAVWGCFTFAKTYFDEETGLIAALLFAVSPWAVLYARKIWCQNMPWATLIFFAAVFATFIKGKKWALVIAFAGLAALLGLHLSGLAAIPILGLAILLYRDRVTLKTIVAGAAVALILGAPYIIHDARNGWPNLHGFLGYAGSESTFSWDAARFAFMLVGSYGIPGQAGPFHEQFSASVPNLWWINHAMSVVLVLGVFYAIWQVVRGETQAQRRTSGLLLLWFTIPIALQLRPSTTTQPHYFIILYPVQFILIATVLVHGLKRLPQLNIRLGRLTVALPALGLAMVLLVWSGWQIAVIRQQRVYMVEHPTTGGHGIPLHFTREAAQLAKTLAGDAGGETPGASPIIVIGESNRPHLTETPTVFDALLFGHPHRFTDGRAALPVPESDGVVYLAGPVREPPSDALQPVLQRLAVWDSVTEGPGIALADGWYYRTFLRESTSRDDVIAGMEPLAGGIPFANNAVFAAYEAPQKVAAGDTIDVWLAWWLRGLPPAGQDVHFTVQLLDASRARLAQDDHAGFPSGYWQTGDLVLSRFVIDVPGDTPAGTYQLRAGMYSYPDITVAPVVDPSGTPIDDGVMLTTVSVQ